MHQQTSAGFLGLHSKYQPLKQALADAQAQLAALQAARRCVRALQAASCTPARCLAVPQPPSMPGPAAAESGLRPRGCRDAMELAERTRQGWEACEERCAASEAAAAASARELASAHAASDLLRDDLQVAPLARACG